MTSISSRFSVYDGLIDGIIFSLLGDIRTRCLRDGDAFLTWALILSSLFVGWGIGANDAANAMGTAVGAKVRTVKQAVVLVTVFGILGAILLGGRVIYTVGKGIFPMNLLEPTIGQLFVLAVSVAAGITVTLSSWVRLPTSTSQALIGGVIGGSLAIGQAGAVNWSVFFRVVIGWAIAPVSAAFLAFIYYRLGKQLLARFWPRKVKSNHLGLLLTISGCCMAFAWGANDVANAVGPITGARIVTPLAGAIIGGLAMGSGVMTWGPRIMHTVGHRITQLVPGMALAAELAAATNIILFTLMGLPASSSHTIVGSVFGVGLSHGQKSVDTHVMAEILAAWFVTPLVGGALGFGLLRGFRLLTAFMG